jgi:hypothetical protein
VGHDRVCCGSAGDDSAPPPENRQEIVSSGSTGADPPDPWSIGLLLPPISVSPLSQFLTRLVSLSLSQSPVSPSLFGFKKNKTKEERKTGKKKKEIRKGRSRGVRELRRVGPDIYIYIYAEEAYINQQVYKT